MTKMRGTKRSLLMSGLALLLCVSMLIGSTFAWFTDSVTSAGNIIKSGTLEISMNWADGKEAPASATWKNAADGAIFNNDKWEPGYTEARHIAVKNEGTLALKYQLTIVPTGEVSKLAEVIDVYYINPAVQLGERADLSAYTPVGTLAQLINNEISAVDVMPNGKLNAGEGFVATLVLKMQESAGNDYQDLSIGTDFSVQLLATQFTSEKDSYDENYDGGASWLGDASIGWYLEGLENDADEFVIGSAEDLAGLAALVNGTATSDIATYAAAQTIPAVSFAGKTVKLATNIDLAGKAWTPIGNWGNTFDGTFDGQGYTISNLNINDPAGEGIGFFGVTVKANIKNVTLENVNIKGYSMVASLVGAAYPAAISNCHVTGDISVVAEWAYVGGIAGYCYYGTQVDGCSVIADGTGVLMSETRNAVGGITAWLLEGDHKVTNCQVKNLDLTGWTNIGGITGSVHYNNTIDGCSVENVKLTKTRADGNPGIGLIAGGWSYSATNAITLSNNSAKNATLNGSHIAYAAYNELYGSEYGGATTTNFVLENNTTENITNNLVEVAAAKTAEELKEALATGEDVVLSDNIAVSKEEAGSNGYGATGIHIGDGQTLDGNGKSVGVDAWGTWDSAINITSGTVRNVTVNNGMRGIFISHNGTAGKVYLENVIIDGTVYTISCDQGTNSGLEATNSTFNGWTSYAATIGDVLFTDCSFGEGQGYAFCRPYAPTTFVGCDFEAGYELDARAAVTFEDCTIGGEALTAENLATLVVGGIANATVK